MTSNNLEKHTLEQPITEQPESVFYRETLELLELIGIGIAGGIICSLIGIDVNYPIDEISS